MRRLVDCFLYNDESELLDLRIRLLAGVVSRFVVVWSPWTFTGRRKGHEFPWSSEAIAAFRERVEVVTLDELPGATAWDKEKTSRNAVERGLHGFDATDLVMISDIDGIPRPRVLARMVADASPATRVLGLDYFNFKFNYQLVHGPQSMWPGPVICPVSSFTTAQGLRDLRWQHVTRSSDEFIYGAGWHFSFLTRTADVKEKLASFSHQETEIQQRTESITNLIAQRRGFHDHLHPCTVWAIVSLGSFECDEIARLVAPHADLLAQGEPDSREHLDREIRMSTIRMLKGPERTKVMGWCTASEIGDEIKRRISEKVRRALPWTNP